MIDLDKKTAKCSWGVNEIKVKKDRLYHTCVTSEPRLEITRCFSTLLYSFNKVQTNKFYDIF